VVAETPGVTLALVGDGPARPGLEDHFRGLPVTFMVRASGAARRLDFEWGSRSFRLTMPFLHPALAPGTSSSSATSVHLHVPSGLHRRRPVHLLTVPGNMQ
jgi:hypothetical protein